MFIPEQADYTARWVGVVVGVADDAQTELRFGDLVEFARWDIQWYPQPLRIFGNENIYRSADKVIWQDPDSEARYMATAANQLGIMPPSKVLYKICSLLGEDAEPGIYPVGDRLLILKDEVPRETESGIVTAVHGGDEWVFKREANGVVVAIGENVDEIAVGDWVASDLNCGTHFKSNGRAYGLVREGDILVKRERPDAA